MSSKKPCHHLSLVTQPFDNGSRKNTTTTTSNVCMADLYCSKWKVYIAVDSLTLKVYGGDRHFHAALPQRKNFLFK